MIKAVLVYSHALGFQDILLEQLDRGGVETLRRVVVPFSWKQKVLCVRDLATKHPDDVLIVLDTWDTSFLGTKQELLDLHLEEGITFAATGLCWPKPELESFYPPSDSPWRFLNSTPMAGLGRNIKAAIDWGWNRFPIKGDTTRLWDSNDDIDMRFWTDLYLQGRDLFEIKLDTECRLAQTMCGLRDGQLFLDGPRKRAVNCVHGTEPIFLHANGQMTRALFLLDGSPERASR